LKLFDLMYFLRVESFHKAEIFKSGILLQGLASNMKNYVSPFCMREVFQNP